MADQYKIRVVIVDDNAEQRKSLRLLLGFEDDIEVIGEASTGQEGVELVRSTLPDIVLMDINLPDIDGIKATDQISQQVTGTGVIMMSIQGEPEYLRRSMLAGARHFLIKPFTSDELSSIIRQVHRIMMAHHPALRTASQSAVDTTADPTAESHQAKIIAVYSSKGGAGRTSIAVNLAIALKQVTNKKVALIDGSFFFGDVGVFLNAADSRTIYDLVPVADQLDERLIQGAMVQHRSGISVLLAPPKPEFFEQITPTVVKHVLDQMVSMFDYIVVDTLPSLVDTTISFLDAAEQVLVVLTLELPVVRGVRLFLDVAEALKYPKDKIMLVLNRSGRDQAIKIEDVEHTVRHAVDFHIADDTRLVTLSINQGVPFILANKDAGISRNVVAMAEKLAGPRETDASVNGAEAAKQPELALPAKRPFPRLFGRR